MVAISGKPMRLGERLGEPLGPAWAFDSVVSRVLRFRSLSHLARLATYMFQPGHATRSTGNRHYLLINNRWVDPTTLDTSMGAMVGTMTADGTGGSLSYTPEIVAPTTVEAISILYTASNVVVPIFSMGFNRALTTGERIALAGLITPIATAAGVSPAACSLVTGQEYQQRCLKMEVNTALAGSATDTFILPADGAGTYAYTVDWGNGAREYVTANTAQTKDYNQTSTFVVKCYGTYRPYFNNGGDRRKLIGLQIGATNHTTMASAFYGCSALNLLVGYADTAAVTNMSSMFQECYVFNQSVSNFNTANVTDMSLMFYVCFDFNQSVSNFNTAAVTDMSGMFGSCYDFNQSVSNFNTAAVTSMIGMFYGCVEFNQSVSNFNTAAVTIMADMFNEDGVFNQSVSNFNTANVTNMQFMFRNCTAFKQSLATFDMEAVTNPTQMLNNCNINETGTSTNYDDTLIAWAAQDLVNGLNLNATNCKYGGDASSGGQQARTAIATDDSWTFWDGGHI